MVKRDALFKKIKIETPVDKVTKQIKALITAGHLKAGDQLPSERKLSEKLGVSRTNIRFALQKLAFYGILKISSQHRAVVTSMNITALEGLITDVLKIENSDFASLVETRVLLEIEAARLAALRRTEEDIEVIEKALIAHRMIVKKRLPAIEQDLLFHLKIVDASKNPVLKSLMLVIAPDIIRSFDIHNICKDERSDISLQEHEEILSCIIEQDEVGAALSMRAHLQDVLKYSYSLK